MRKNTLALAAASLLVAVVIGPPLYAEGTHDASGSMMNGGMMNGGTMDGGASTNGKHGSGTSMGNMMGMMQKMSRMMDRCNDMMDSDRPNDKWRKRDTPAPEERG